MLSFFRRWSVWFWTGVMGIGGSIVFLLWGLMRIVKWRNAAGIVRWLWALVVVRWGIGGDFW